MRGAGTGRLAQFPLTVATGTGVALQTNRCTGPASVGATLDSSAPSPEAEVAPGRTSAHIGSLRITAGPNQAIRLRKIDIRNDSSLDLEDVYVENFSATGRPRVGTSVDELDSGRTLSFPQSGGRLDLEVPANSSVTLDIFATIPASCTRFDEIRMSVPASGIKATGRLLGDVVFSSATSLSLQTLNCVSPSFSVEKDTSFSDTIITSSDEGRLPVAGFKIVTDSPAEEIDINSLTFRKTGGLALSEPRLFLVLAGGGTTEMYSTRPEFNGAGEVTFPWTFTITGVGERKFILKAKVQSGCTAGDDALIYVTQDSVLAEGSTSSIDLDAKPDTDLALHAVTCGTTTVPD